MSAKIDPQLIKIKLLGFAEKLQHCKPEFQYAIGALLVGFILTLITPLYDFFSLTPSHIFTFQLWKLATFSFFEPNLLVLLYNFVVAYQFFYLIEPVWGHAESIKFAAIVQLITPLCIALIAIFEFAFFQSFNFYYYGILNGLSPLAVGILVAVKQFLPDTVVVATPFGRIKNNHLPGCSLAGSFILWIFGFVRGAVIFQIAFGIQVAWCYLRFYQIQSDTHEFGDHSEHFAWATLFPRRTQPVAVTVGKAVYRTLVKLKICKHVEYTGFEQFEPVDVVFPTPESRDAERRRQKALRDLNERLGRTKANNSPGDMLQMDVVAPDVVVVPNSARPASAIADSAEFVPIQHSQSFNELKSGSGTNY
uniref:Uncharacterized protein n=1 Tax=Panagrolaimus sp. JU765 TaxID=591449 RepID=A0AC34QCS5_9BILA